MTRAQKKHGVTKMTQRDYDRSVADVKALLSRAHSAWVDVFLKLREIERGYLWKIGGHGNFTDFLRVEFPNALGIEKYSNAISAIELYGEAEVRKYGIECAHIMMARPFQDDPAKRRLLTRTMDVHFEEHGVYPGVDRVRQMARGIDPSLVKPVRETQDVLRQQELLAENAALKKRVKELTQENAQLKKQVRGSSKGSSKSAN